MGKAAWLKSGAVLGGVLVSTAASRIASRFATCDVEDGLSTYVCGAAIETSCVSCCEACDGVVYDR